MYYTLQFQLRERLNVDTGLMTDISVLVLTGALSLAKAKIIPCPTPRKVTSVVPVKGIIPEGPLICTWSRRTINQESHGAAEANEMRTLVSN